MKTKKHRVFFAAAIFCLGVPAGVLESAARPKQPASPPAAAARADVTLTIDPARVVGSVDEKVYGHFFEHIYHSANGGLWGELVWNRSFEEPSGWVGQWVGRGEQLAQKSLSDNVRLVFGDPKWTDYEFTVEARKTGGAEGFLVLFRVAGDEDFYWANLGGWGNKRHAIERGNKGRGRWGVVGKAVPGSIRQGKWYQIKVRCEGPRISVSLDGKTVIDFTDRDGKLAHSAGAVGLGTWRTAAEFRNLKVDSLDGKVLHEGLPTKLPPSGVGRFWEACGSGEVQLVSEKPLNGDFCLRISCPSGEAGVRQAPLGVRAGETYVGSLWARGKAPGGLIVRLVGDAGTLAEQPLHAPSGEEWKEMTYELTPRASQDGAALQVVAAGSGEVWIDQVSLMPKSWRADGGFRPDLLKAIADLRPPVIRWPGGCYAEQYRWKDGIGPQHKRGAFPRSMWDDRDVNSLGTDEFIDLCRRVGAEPLIVINTGRHDKGTPRSAYLREALDWIEYCNGPADSKWGEVRRTYGHQEPYRVKYWEIDNETWESGIDAYIEIVKEFSPAMRKADPSITLLLCGGSGAKLSSHDDWDPKLIAQCADLGDYLSIHHYENPARFADGPAADEKWFADLAGLIAKSKNPDLKLYVSEWNAQSTDWRTGLYAGAILNAFERCGEVVKIGGPALFLRHVSASAWDNAFINFDHRTWFPAPNYVVMKLWRDHYAPIRLETGRDADPLNAVATRSADGRTVYLKAVNPTDKPVSVALTVKDGFVPSGAEMQVVAADSLEARNTLEHPDAVRAVPAKADCRGRVVTFVLPKFSAAVVTLRRR